MSQTLEERTNTVRKVCFNERTGMLCGPEHKSLTEINTCRERPEGKKDRVYSIEILPAQREDRWTGYREVMYSPNTGYQDLPNS
jgi:hypothetical protein